MKLYLVTLFNPVGLSEQVIKIFSTKENLDRWLEIAKFMDRELYGENSRDITQSYKIKECDLDNLDFVELYAEAKQLGSIPKQHNQ